MEWTVFSHPPYSPDLTPSDFKLLRTLKDEIRGPPFADDEVKYSMREKLRRFKKKSFTHTASQSILIMKETLWKNNLSFVKDVPMIQVNLIINSIIAYEKKEALFSYSLL